jgi:ATP-dependent exoDNAse (exonuclease V) alpha subunit
MVERWRKRWAELANERLAELDIDARIDHRSLEAQGIALEAQTQIGASAQRIEGEGIAAADRAEMHHEIARGNGERITANPDLGLDAITHQQSTFTRRDMARFAHRHSDGIEQFNEVMGAMQNAPDLVELGKEGRSEDRFTTRDMIEAEQRLHRAAKLMAERERHEVNDADRQASLARAEQRGLALSGEQADALAHVTDRRDLGIVVGHPVSYQKQHRQDATNAIEIERKHNKSTYLVGIRSLITVWLQVRVPAGPTSINHLSDCHFAGCRSPHQKRLTSLAVAILQQSASYRSTLALAMVSPRVS